MMRRILLGLPLLLLVVFVGMQAGQPAQAQNPNLLRNPGFEGTYSAWQPNFTTAQVAPDWTPWWKNDLNADPQIAMPEWKPAHKRDFDYRVHEGETAQAWFTFYRSHYGGMYQQVSGLEVGATYRFQVYVQAWNSAESSNARESERPGDPRFRVGIHPSGDARPGLVGAEPDGIVWSELASMASILDKYAPVWIEAVALNETITVYMNSNPQYANKHNDFYVDAASLVKVAEAPNQPAPQPTQQPAPQPQPTQAPPNNGGNNGGNAAFTATVARWTNVYDAPGGAQVGVFAPETHVNLHQRTQSSDWYEVSANGIRGWVPATALKNINTGGGSSGGSSGGNNGGNTGGGTASSIVRWTNVYDSPGGAVRQGVALAPGTSIFINNYDGSGNWANISGDFGNGWVPATATAGTGGGSSPAPQPQAPAPAPQPTQPPAPAPAPQPTGTFELGGQTHTFANPSLMSDTGMNWVKFQHKWGPGNTGQEVAARVSDAHSKGFKVLLSMPGSPYPSSIDFAAYTQFLGNVASLPDPPDAIEIWNEMNIDFEWPAGQISASQYFNEMLKPGYNAIKAANPNIMVISGAPAPTGFFGGGCAANGCDDQPYMEELGRLGGANYMDCVGVHYNAGATSPTQSQGHPADSGARHYSWYYQPMVDVYYNAFNGQVPLCFTEIGYLSGDDYGGVPPRFAWASNTSVSEHAQWLGEAVTLAKNSGKVRLFVIFNVDFTLYSDDPQAGYAMIRKNGGCPACQTIKSAMGR